MDFFLDLFARLPAGVFVARFGHDAHESRILYANPAFEAVTGWEAARLVDRPLADLLGGLDEAGPIGQIRHGLIGQQRWSGSMVVTSSEGVVRLHDWAIAALSVHDPLLAVVAVQPDAGMHLAQLVERVTRDPLTGLLTKSAVLEQLSQRVKRAQAGHRPYPMVAHIDLDRFASLRSLLSGDVVDGLLRQIASTIVEAVGADSAGYIEPDRFLIISSDLHALEQVMDGFGRPIEVSGTTIYLTATTGLAMFPADGRDGDELVRAAMLATQDGKRSGGDGLYFYQETSAARIERVRRIEDGLRSANWAEGAHLVYQPKVSLATGKLKGVEALMRWRHPTLGAVSPAEFIPIAEQTRLIDRIGAWVAETALVDFSKRFRGSDISCSINVSPLQLLDEKRKFARLVSDVAGSSGLTADQVVIEITEGMFSDSVVLERAEEFRASGHGIAIDDFGREYSSIALLTRLPATKLKLDKSLADDIAVDDRKAKVVRRVVDLAHDLGMCVVAEGVEHVDQLIPLRAMGCDEVQGFVFARPMALADVPLAV